MGWEPTTPIVSTTPISLDLGFDEVFSHILDRSKVDSLRLDHRLGELLRVDIFTSTPSGPQLLRVDAFPLTPRARSPQPLSTSDHDAADPIEPELRPAHPIDSAPYIDYDANRHIPAQSAEDAALTFISSDHLAVLNELTQGVEPLFDCQNKSAECLPNSKPPLFRGRFSIRLLKGIGDHAPFTTFSTDPSETFPTKKLATSNAVRAFFNMYPEFYPHNRA